MEPNSLGLRKLPEQTKVCVAMSGGVDSSATVYLLKKQGYDVFGLTMDLLQPPYAPAVSSIADAAKVAQKLGVEHEYINMKDDFRRDVIDYFANSYLSGQTPSPCIMCNKQIKLGRLAEEARKRGADILVTGHYAEVRMTETGAELYRGANPVRDQSYFLFAISRETLQMLRCPLAGYSKEQTRALAAEAGLEVAHKADSQDICFVSSGKYAELISALRPDYKNIPGDIVATSGEVLGRHKGLIHYTIGQRRGLGIGGRKGHDEREVWYVKALDAMQNRVIVGSEAELFCTEVNINNLNWLGGERPTFLECAVKLRSRQPLVPAIVEFENDNAVVRLQEKFSAAAPGQGCCFYVGNRVMGGGFIC